MLIAGVGAVWASGVLASAQVISHFAVIAMIPAVVTTLFGTRWLKVLWFPMAFLVFAVPFGEGLVPKLMDWTADFTVAAVQTERCAGLPRRHALRDPVRPVVGHRGLQRHQVPDCVADGRVAVRVAHVPVARPAAGFRLALHRGAARWPTGCAPT